MWYHNGGTANLPCVCCASCSKSAQRLGRCAASVQASYSQVIGVPAMAGDAWRIAMRVTIMGNPLSEPMTPPPWATSSGGR